MVRDDVGDQLARVAIYEAGLRRTPLTRFLLRAGRNAMFARVYAKVGPLLDPLIYRQTGGSAATRVYGLPALLLTMTGAQSGHTRTATLLYVRDGDGFAVVGTNFGKPAHPAWTTNLLAHPVATVQVGPERIAVTATPAADAEWERLWRKFLAINPGYHDYLARSGRRPRIFVLAPRPAGSP
jgi:deazaflavin-dependent oxidoreductase (nitroreductase family)